MKMPIGSCKDCLSYDVCSIADIMGKNFCCPDCKDRNRFVELPCKVGDTVYSIKNHNIYERKVTRIIFDPITIIQFMAKDYVCYASPIGRNDFGKTVFLTREEAERALNSSEKTNG